MVGKHPVIVLSLFHQLKERVNILRGDVGGGAAHLLPHLREHRATHPIPAAAQIYQQQRRILAGRQDRCQYRANVVTGGKCRHNQRDGRSHSAVFALFLPHGAHGHRVLADGDRNAERRTKVAAHGGDRVVKDRFIPLKTRCTHPVCRQLDVAQ